MKCQDCPFYDKGECNSIEHMNHYDNGHSLGYAEGLRKVMEVIITMAKELEDKEWMQCARLVKALEALIKDRDTKWTEEQEDTI